MTDMTIIGSGNMARAIGLRAAAAGESVQVLDRNPDNAARLAAELGDKASSGGLGDVPEGDIVVLALYFEPAKEVAAQRGHAQRQDRGGNQQSGQHGNRRFAGG